MSGYTLTHAILDGCQGEVSALRSTLGAAGYGLLWMLLEELTTSSTLTLAADYADLSSRFGVEEALLRSVVNDYGFFVVEGDALSMPLLTENKRAYDAGRQRRHERAKKAASVRWGAARDAISITPSNEVDASSITTSETDVNTTSITTGCNEHSEGDASSITSCNTTDSATSILSHTRTCARSHARAKRNNTSYSKTSSTRYKPVKETYIPPYPPSSFSAGENVEHEEGAGRLGELSALREELVQLRRQVEQLSKKQRRASSSRRKATASEGETAYLATLAEPWRKLVGDWITYRREIGSPVKGRLAVSKFCDRLRELSGGDPTSARRIIDRSMANGYKGIELRISGSNGNCGGQKTDALGRAIDSTVGQDYSRPFFRSVREVLASQGGIIRCVS